MEENSKKYELQYSIQKVVELYSVGAFPMGEENGDINWYLPKERWVLFPGKYNIPRTLKKFMKTANFEYRFDTARREVIEYCSQREETWITPELMDIYDDLIDSNILHTVEVWQNGEFVGGLYGIALRGIFFGESMFSLVSQASKCALVKLMEHLENKGFEMCDVQLYNDHLSMFGIEKLSYNEYKKILAIGYSKDVNF
jgi:leucyl/phenylalanyl-tRNA--protein transferase